MESEGDYAKVRVSSQCVPPQPTISVTHATTGSYLHYGFPDGRPISTCSIESVASFICSEASSWTSGDDEDDYHLLTAVHRLSMSSASSWTVSELGDEAGDETKIGFLDDEIYPPGEKDQLVEDSLLALAYFNGETDDAESAMSCHTTTTASESGECSSSDSVIMNTSDPGSKNQSAVDALRQKRQSRIIEECDIDNQVCLDVTIDDSRVAQAFLVQQDSTLVAMSEARILQLPFQTGNIMSAKSMLMSKQLGGLSGSKTLNRLGKIPDVAAVTSRPSPNRRQVAHLNFWERITSNALHGDPSKRRSMLY